MNIACHAIQTLLATSTIAVILTIEDMFTGGGIFRGILIAVLGSTGFVLFITPHTDAARPLHSLEGHTIAIGIGTCIGIIAYIFPIIPIGAAAALAVGLAMFVMALTGTGHAPAAGTALGVSVQGFHWDVVAMFMLEILVLAINHHLFKRKLENLLG